MACRVRVAVVAFVVLAAAAAAVAAAPPAKTPTAPLIVDVTGVPVPPARALDAARVEAGRKVYAARCQGCHGVSGAGDGPVGRLLQPKPQAFSDAFWQARVTDDEMRQAIVRGGAAVNKAASMPPAKDLAPDAVDAVIAFVRSLRAPHGTASVTIMNADGHDVVVDVDAAADGHARVVVPGVSGHVTVLTVVDVGGAPACTLDVVEAAGAHVACAATTR
jgi:mono/diheme cytochrome c family protein